MEFSILMMSLSSWYRNNCKINVSNAKWNKTVTFCFDFYIKRSLCFSLENGSKNGFIVQRTIIVRFLGTFYKKCNGFRESKPAPSNKCDIESLFLHCAMCPEICCMLSYNNVQRELAFNEINVNFFDKIV